MNTTIETTLQSAIESAVTEVQSLAEEMRNWFDNTPESLQETDRMVQVGEVAETLEGLNEPEAEDDIPEDLLHRKVTFSYRQPRRFARRHRRDWASAHMEAAKSRLEEYLSQTAEQCELNEEEEPAHLESVRQLIEDIENYVDEINSLQFPGAR